MSDLHNLLHDVSPAASSPTDVAAVRRRARHRRYVRRAAGAGASLVLLLGVVTMVEGATRNQVVFTPGGTSETEQDIGSDHGDGDDRGEPQRASDRELLLQGRERGSGDQWRMFGWITDAGHLCLELAGVGCGSVPSDGEDPAPWTLFSSSGLQPNGRYSKCVYGALAPSVATVQLEFTDGTTHNLEPVAASFAPETRFYAYCYRDAPDVAKRIALAADGTVLAESEVPFAGDLSTPDASQQEPEMRPDLMVVEPPVAAPGEELALWFPEETQRGIAFELHRRTDRGWITTHWMNSDANGTQYAATAPVGTNGFSSIDVGIGGSGPDHVALPDDLPAGEYRVCTANARDEFCAPLTVTKISAPN